MCKLIGSIVFLLYLILMLDCSKEKGKQDGNFFYQSEEKKVEESSFRICASPSLSIDIFEKIWLEFSSKNTLEVAGPKDFRFPEALLQDYYTKADIERWARCPVITGDFNYDQIDDFLVIVVNNKIDSDEKFSLIIFNVLKSRKNADTISFSPEFVYQNRNLSKLYIGKSRSGLSVRAYQEDSSSISCYINWNSKTKSYQCK